MEPRWSPATCRQQLATPALCREQGCQTRVSEFTAEKPLKSRLIKPMACGHLPSQTTGLSKGRAVTPGQRQARSVGESAQTRAHTAVTTAPPPGLGCHGTGARSRHSDQARVTAPKGQGPRLPAPRTGQALRGAVAYWAPPGSSLPGALQMPPGWAPGGGVCMLWGPWRVPCTRGWTR